MKQDGKVKVIEEGTRRVFYVDVGDMSPAEALRIINEIRNKQGMPPVNRSWTTWVGVGLLIIAGVYVASAVLPMVLPLLP